MTDIYFPVRKVPIEEIAAGYDYPSGLSHAIIVTKPDGEERIVQFCSDLYHLVPNDTVIPELEKEVSRFFKIEKKIKMWGWSRFFIDFIIKDKSIEISKGDNVFARFRTINSYDGAIRYHYQMGFWRQICGNGLTIPIGEVRELVSMHTPKLGKETSFEALLQMTSEFMAEASDIAEIYYELQENTVKDWMMRIEEVAEETSFPISLTEDVAYRMGKELEALPGIEPNDWLVYNAFNYQLNHNDELKAKESKKDTMDQEVLDYLLRY